MTLLVRTLAGILLGVLVLAGGSVPTSAAPAEEARVVYYDLGQARVEPRVINTAYSSAPSIRGISWKRWGTAKAVGRGVYVSDCASCPPPKRRAARVVLRGLVACEKDDTRTYRRAVVKVSEPDEGSTVTTYRLFAGCARG